MLLSFVCVDGFSHVYMCTICVQYLHSEKRVLEPLELELQTVVSCLSGAGSCAWVFFKSSQCFYLLSHLSSPPFQLLVLGSHCAWKIVELLLLVPGLPQNTGHGAQQCKDTACASTSHKRQLLPPDGILTFILLLKNSPIGNGCGSISIGDSSQEKQYSTGSLILLVLSVFKDSIFSTFVCLLSRYIKWVMLPVLFCMRCHLVLPSPFMQKLQAYLFTRDTLYLEEQSMTFDSMKF